MLFPINSPSSRGRGAGGGGGVNLTNFGRDLKPYSKVNLGYLKHKISCWDCCSYFIVPEN